MKLLYCSTFMFRQEKDGTYCLPSCADSFFQKYLDVFDEVRVIGVPMRNYIDITSLTRIEDERISVRIVRRNATPLEFKNDKDVKTVLIEEIAKAEALLIKPASRFGMMAIHRAKRNGKPYMIELTGDIHNALRQHPSLLKRMYSPLFYRQIKKSINDCKFGLYVSRDYLQSQFPISGEMCGCSDVILKFDDETVLERRMKRIETLCDRERVDIALIGFYQGLMKGVDTAIRALAQLPENFHLNILGNGTEENRQKWIRYGEERGVVGRINYPPHCLRKVSSNGLTHRTSSYCLRLAKDLAAA